MPQLIISIVKSYRYKLIELLQQQNMYGKQIRQTRLKKDQITQLNEVTRKQAVNIHRRKGRVSDKFNIL
jgi:hypothetical protein